MKFSDLKTMIDYFLEQRKTTKSLIYNDLGISQQTFLTKAKNETFTIKEYSRICDILNISPILYFDIQNIEYSNNLNEDMAEYKKVKNDTKIESVEKEVIFLRNRVVELISIISELSKKIDK